jgi:hypothetical protein
MRNYICKSNGLYRQGFAISQWLTKRIKIVIPAKAGIQITGFRVRHGMTGSAFGAMTPHGEQNCVN